MPFVSALQPRHPDPAWRGLIALPIWAAGAAVLSALDGRVDLSNLAMLMVLTSALASIWPPVLVSMALSAAGVLAFNWCFVAPRGSFSVALQQNVWLLTAMLLVNWIIALLMAAQRSQAQRAREHQRRAEQLRSWGDAVRDAVDPLAQAGALVDALRAFSDGQVALLVLKDALPEGNDADHVLQVGEADEGQLAALWYCLREGRAMGPGTGWHQELPQWFLPLRGRGRSFGAALLGGHSLGRVDPEMRAHAQALCDQMGQALQRAQAAREEGRARELAQTQGVRNALLAAISHDYRTPLATIMGAASSLEEQGDKPSAEQRRRLAHTIVDETTQLGRLTDNTLQLARLDAPGVTLRCDWESAEEIVGALLHRARRRDPQRRVRARLEPGLPLLWCDALLLSQLLDNLVDNALKYSPAESPVEVLVRRVGDQVVLAVRDRGPGVALAWRERIFEVFQRGGATQPAGTQAVERVSASRPGAGVGLAVCRAIARAHGGELRLRPRGHGGCAFECVLPVVPPPPEPAESAELVETTPPPIEGAAAP